MEISLDQLTLGKEGIVAAINTEKSLDARLRAFGFVPGTVVRCRYRSPGGNVTALDCRGCVLALRTRDMRNIRVRC